MNNVIKLETVNNEAITLLQQEIEKSRDLVNGHQEDIAKAKKLHTTYELAVTDAVGEDKKAALRLKNKAAITIKTSKEKLAAEEKTLDQQEIELATLQNQIKKVAKKEASSDNVVATFEANNLHYVINGGKWWSVDSAGDRCSPHINQLDASEVMDLVYLGTDWFADQKELKTIAKENDRMFKYIARDFEADRPGVYNQMKDIRKLWLEPIYDIDPDPAFRVLTMAIAGGNEEYSDYLEKIVAYRYCHPEDVMIPNIDSCATGGTGRDTYFGMLRNIFTDECCADANEETITGTHNAELLGRMWIKISEQQARTMPIDKIKNLTGDRKYRHRAMGENARDVPRLFSFLFFRNGFTTTAKLAGSGSAGEDRRFEPIIARHNLARHTALHLGLITELNVEDFGGSKAERESTTIIKQWQSDVYRNDQHIAEWLGHCIVKHKVRTMKEFLPLHGEYYQEMIKRQQAGISIFMPKIMNLMAESTVLSLPKLHKLYDIVENQKTNKDWFKNQVLHWLSVNKGWDPELSTLDVWPNIMTADIADRRRFVTIKDRRDPNVKPIFNIYDFIKDDAVNEKGDPVNDKICVESIKDDLL